MSSSRLTGTQVAVLLVSVLAAPVLTAKLPEEFPRCHVNDVELNKCLGPAIEKSLHSLKDGQKSLGLPPLSPLIVEEMTLDLGSGPVALLINGKNISITGLQVSSVKHAELDVDKHVLTVEALTKRLRLDFQYAATGRILLVAVKGEGPAFFEFEDLKSTHKLIAEPIEKKGKTYWNVTDFQVDVEPAKMSCHFEGLLKGNPQVSEQINGFLNNDWKLFFQQIKGPATEAFGAIFLQMASRVFSRVPIGDIFLDM